MKLKFSIHYHTAWGESLHVCIDFHRQDGTVRHQNLLMQTEDGELWTLETSALMSRQHPLSHIQYRYQVEDSDEQVLRKEWDMPTVEDGDTPLASANLMTLKALLAKTTPEPGRPSADDSKPQQ